MRRRTAAAGAVAACSAALGLPALAAAASVGATHLQVTPAHPGTRSDVVVRFAEPTISGLLPGQDTTEALQVTGPARAGCAAGTSASLAVTSAGTAVRQVFAPARMTGRRWCTGVHTVTLTVTTFAPCPVGVGPVRIICPQADDAPRSARIPRYVVAPTVVATARFRIAAAR